MTFQLLAAGPNEWMCVKEKCAWWIEHLGVHGKNGCALKMLALSMEIYVGDRKRFIMAMEKHR